MTLIHFTCAKRTLQQMPTRRQGADTDNVSEECLNVALNKNSNVSENNVC